MKSSSKAVEYLKGIILSLVILACALWVYTLVASDQKNTPLPAQQATTTSQTSSQQQNSNNAGAPMYKPVDTLTEELYPLQTLQQKNWMWIETIVDGGVEQIQPKRDGVFSLTFGSDNKLSIATDCNAMFATYTLGMAAQDKIVLSISDIGSTMMYCEGSQESMFAGMISRAQSLTIDEFGVLNIRMNDGVIRLK